MVSADLKRAQQSSDFSGSHLEQLREQLSSLLSDSYLKVEKRDEAIKARIQELMDISREKSSVSYVKIFPESPRKSRST